ncbi:MAG: hypothetical protein MUF44_00280, partial [Hydrogenophaga sp.]|nr:hypothetical protein [Hydrogenophaga sp.]
WIYTLVFAFASLWFTHYALAVLHNLRSSPLAADVVEVTPSAVEVLPGVPPPPSPPPPNTGS